MKYSRDLNKLTPLKLAVALETLRLTRWRRGTKERRVVHYNTFGRSLCPFNREQSMCSATFAVRSRISD